MASRGKKRCCRKRNQGLALTAELRKEFSKLSNEHLERAQHAQELWDRVRKKRFQLTFLGKMMSIRLKGTANVGAEHIVKRNKKCMLLINPRSTWKVLWDVFINLLYLLSFFLVPSVIAFHFKDYELFSGIELIVDFFLLIDMVFYFFLRTKPNTKSYEQTTREVTMCYLRSYFIVDFLGIVPGFLTLESFW